jgi:hypothetical protein
MCKISCIKPELKKSTTYRKSFNKYKSDFKGKIKDEFIPKTLKTVFVDLETTYHERYTSQRKMKENPLK